MDTSTLFEDTARDALVRGLRLLAKAVTATLGPGGQLAVIARSNKTPLVTKDGVTVAYQVYSEDPHEDMGIQIMREAAAATEQGVGDGTTTATALAHAIVEAGLKASLRGFSPTAMLEGIQRAVDAVSEFLEEISEPVTSYEDLQSVGRISANGDVTIGDMAAEAIDKVTEEGAVMVLGTGGTRITFEHVDGCRLDRGYKTSTFANTGDVCELYNPYVLVTDRALSRDSELAPILNKIAQTEMRRPLLVIAGDIENSALQVLTTNKEVVGSCAVLAPGYGLLQRDLLEDLAAIFNTKGCWTDGRGPESMDLADLGSCKQVVVTPYNTTIFRNPEVKTLVEERAGHLRKEREKTTNPYDLQELTMRIAKLVAGVGIIRVGAHSRSKQEEVMARVQDAVSAVRAAKRGGTVYGGGVALLRARLIVERLAAATNDEFVRTGITIVHDALSVPMRTLVANLRGPAPDVVVNQVAASSNDAYGYDARSKSYCDLRVAGIIDPTDVVKSALSTAAEVAGVMLTAAVSIPLKPKS